MRKPLLALLVLFANQAALGQLVELKYTGTQRPVAEEPRIEGFGRSGFEVFANGVSQSSVQVLKLRIGEPGGFSLPFYILVGTTGAGLGSATLQEHVASAILNSTGGTLNVSLNDDVRLLGNKDKVTKLRFKYQAGGKLVSTGGVTENFLIAGFGSAGLRFQTGAWGVDDPKNLGLFWLQGLVGGATSSTARLQDVFGTAVANTMVSYSLEVGIEINDLLNLKAGIYRETKNDLLPGFDEPLMKFAFDYKRK